MAIYLENFPDQEVKRSLTLLLLHLLVSSTHATPQRWAWGIHRERSGERQLLEYKEIVSFLQNQNFRLEWESDKVLQYTTDTGNTIKITFVIGYIHSYTHDFSDYDLVISHGMCGRIGELLEAGAVVLPGEVFLWMSDNVSEVRIARVNKIHRNQFDEKFISQWQIWQHKLMAESKLWNNINEFCGLPISVPPISATPNVNFLCRHPLRGVFRGEVDLLPRDWILEDNSVKTL